MNEYPTSKIIRSIEAVLEIVFKLAGVYITYLTFNFCAELLFKEDFNSNTLFSLLMLPALYLLRASNIIISPYFVKVSISENDVETRTGILTQRLDKLSLKTVENIEVVTTLGGRIFNYSTIYLYAYGSWVELPFLNNSDEIKQKIESKLNKIRGK
jgi:uncharacterized membrane protein YdbT with pleckstrin-like domain